MVCYRRGMKIRGQSVGFLHSCFVFLGLLPPWYEDKGADGPLLHRCFVFKVCYRRGMRRRGPRVQTICAASQSYARQVGFKYFLFMIEASMLKVIIVQKKKTVSQKCPNTYARPVEFRIILSKTSYFTPSIINTLLFSQFNNSVSASF